LVEYDEVIEDENTATSKIVELEIPENAIDFDPDNIEEEEVELSEVVEVEPSE
jgi:hypothetical protein